MEIRVTLRPPTPRSSSLFLIFFFLVFTSAEKVSALDFTSLPTDPIYSAEQSRTVDLSRNSCFTDSNTSSSSRGRALFIHKTKLHKDPYYDDVYTKKYEWTAVGLYFDYLPGFDFSSVRVSLYPANNINLVEFSKPLVSGVTADATRTQTVSVDGQSKALQLIFPFYRVFNLSDSPFQFSDGTSANGVVLTISCFSGETQAASFWERGSGSEGIGHYNYFDPLTKTISLFANPYDARIAFTFFSGHPTAPGYPPVLFLHEAGKNSIVWDELISKLAYSRTDYVDRFDDFDDNLTLTTLSQKLKTRVLALTQKSLSDWGEGKVDLVGYGLGGLVAERYLLDNPSEHHVRRLVTVGTPFKGTNRLDFAAFTLSTSPLGKWLMQKYPQGWNNIVSSSFNVNNVATKSLADGFPDRTPPSDVAYYSIAGNIQATYRQPLFHFQINKREDLGDLLIPSDSPSPGWIPSDNFYHFSQPVKFTGSMVQSSSSVSLPFNTETDISASLHGKLLTNSLVVNKVVEILKR